MKVALVGFAGCGKTTIFNVLTGLHAEVGSFTKGRMNLGNIKVPDPRIDKLAAIYNPKKKVYAEIIFADLVGASSGEPGKGLDPAALSEMRNSDALALVVRGFDNPALPDPPAPARELKEFEQEMILADLVQVEKRLERMAKEGNKNPREKALMDRLKAQLDAEQPLRGITLGEEERASLSGYAFLSLKPMFYLFNVAEDKIGQTEPDPALAQLMAERGQPLITLAGKAEMEITELPEEEQAVFLAELGIKEPARAHFIRTAYASLDLISFLTVGEDECRAWPIKRGTSAVHAAGKVHSDIERGFIRAEIMAYDDFMAVGNEAKMKELGKVHLEGKEYVMRDGDIVHFRFNV